MSRSFIVGARYLVSLPTLYRPADRPRVLVFERLSPTRPWLLMRLYHSKEQDSATVAGDGLLLIHPSTVIREAQPEDMAPVKAGPRPKSVREVQIALWGA